VAKAKKTASPVRSNTEIRRTLLHYFYERNRTSTSSRGKKGSGVKISVVKAELKAQHALTQQEVQSNLTYLISQGWVHADSVTKQFQARGGTVIPSSTTFYEITASGIDKIEGTGEFTMPKFHGINIQATGRNIITVGDGNQIGAEFQNLGTALSELREAILASPAVEADKLNYVADIETIQSQLAKPTPSQRILGAAWQALKAVATLEGCAAAFQRASPLIAPLIA
jgi:hypothetical protein